MRTRKELRDRVYDIAYEISGNKYYKGDIEIVLSAFFYAVQDSLVHDEQVHIRGFGTFNPHHYGRRRVLNPGTGEQNFVEPYVGAKFVPGESLKRALKEGIVRYQVVSTDA